MPDVYGSQFRRVTLTDEARRGLLGKGSILMVTSHADRTSPVLRGKWILENLLGTPPPPPPAERAAARAGRRARSRAPCASGWRRIAPTRSCASCHRLMDPLGFALENFDAVGGWRTREAGAAVDAAGALTDGTPRRRAWSSCGRRCSTHPDVFVRTLTEKLLIYALGRGPAALRHAGGAGHRARRRGAATTGSRRSCSAIVKSAPFQMRRKAGRDGSRRTRVAGKSRGVVMFITKEVVAAPDVPAGTGHRVALPFLESMVPAFTALAQTPRAAAAAVRRRLLPERRADHANTGCRRRRTGRSRSRRS